MTRSGYDPIADDYAAFVSESLAGATTVLAVATQAVLAHVSEVAGLTICNRGCGEGHLARRLAEQGARVLGVDIAAALLTLANRQSDGSNPRFVLDDAQRLASLDDHVFDLVVCNMALMDVPNLAACYEAVGRVLRPEGRLVFSITHPCFQAPAAENDVDHDGRFLARRVSRYATEGYWRSTNIEGIRGRVGAHHRTLATYVNQLASEGFAIERLAELGPASVAGNRVHVSNKAAIPSVLIVAARRQPVSETPPTPRCLAVGGGQQRRPAGRPDSIQTKVPDDRDGEQGGGFGRKP